MPMTRPSAPPPNSTDNPVIKPRPPPAKKADKTTRNSLYGKAGSDDEYDSTEPKLANYNVRLHQSSAYPPSNRYSNETQSSSYQIRQVEPELYSQAQKQRPNNRLEPRNI